VSHATGTGGLSSLRLLAPVPYANHCQSSYPPIAITVESDRCQRTLSGASRRVTARRASVLLDVERAASCVPICQLQCACSLSHPTR
jgi:hypothetical protein